MVTSEHLNYSETVSENEILEYLQQRSFEASEKGLNVMPIDQFWQAGDLQQFYSAKAWWPAHAQGVYQCPTLGYLCDSIAVPQSLPSRTFMENLLLISNTVVIWLRENRHDIINPNETKEQRKTRLARESVARNRNAKAKNTTSAHKEQLAKVRDAYENYMQICRERKEQDSLYAAQAKEAYETYQQLKQLYS